MVWAILNINESVSLLGAKSLQLLGMHALSACDAVTYPIWSWQCNGAKGTVFGEQSATHKQLLETGRKFICSLYGVAAGESMASAMYAL